MKNTQIDTVMLRTNNDCRTLLGFDGQHKELANPCPKCGGSDRLHVTADWFFCRQCHPKRGDCIELMCWLHNCDFKAAIAMLGGEHQQPTPPKPRQPEQKRRTTVDDWSVQASRLADECHKRLWLDESKAAQEYLLARGIEPGTWMAFEIGYRPDTPLPKTYQQQRRAAIVLPWRMSSGIVTAIRYRFLDTSEYMTSDFEWRTVKITSEAGSQFSSRLFGGQVVKTSMPELRSTRTLVICEGEINAMSIWQVAQDSGLDVLSLGSESQVITPVMAKLAADYRHVIVWMDKPEIAESIIAKTPGAVAFASPNGQDANDLLKVGQLGGVLSALRLKTCRTTSDMTCLKYQIYEAADTLHGIDGGTAGVLRKIEPALAIIEAEPDRWIAS